MKTVLLIIFLISIDYAHALLLSETNTEENLHEIKSEGGRNIKDFVTMAQRLGSSGLLDRFYTFQPLDLNKTYWSYLQPQNYARNRHTCFVMYDYNRVILNYDNNSKTSSDFLNGNYVDGFKHKREYIAAECPMTSTIRDFFGMMWDQKISMIVMVTSIIESVHVRCFQYWPLEEGDLVVYGNLKVKTIKVMKNEDYTASTLEIRNSLQPNEVRIVTHWYYTGWLDQKTPSVTEMLKLISEVRAKQAEEDGSPAPIVVHCSAGVGRTGTFILLNNAISRLLDIGTINLSVTLQTLRDQRAYSVATPSQWIFVHRALIQFSIDKNLLTSDFDLQELNFNDDDADNAYTNKVIYPLLMQTFMTATSHLASTCWDMYQQLH